MHKVTYEYKGIKVSIEASESASRDDVEKAINNSKDKLLKLFEPLEGMSRSVSYRNEVPKVLTPKNLAEILCISEKTAYDLVKKALRDDNMFRVVSIGKIYKIPRDNFLNWLEGIDSI